LQIPRTFEYTIGAERELLPGIGLAVDLIYRKFTHQYEQRETNQIWNESGTERIGYRNGRPEQIQDMGTPEGANRYYAGMTVALNKRAGRLKSYVSYTLSRLEGTVFDGASNPWGEKPGRALYLYGPGPDDHAHDVKASLQYSLTSWLSTGIRYNFSSGFPYNMLFRNDATGSYEDRRASPGMSPGVNPNDPGDDRKLRTPDRQELNVQVRLNLEPLIRQKLDLYVDALNILNLRTPTGFEQNQGTVFNTERTWMAPFRMRLGLNYRF